MRWGRGCSRRGGGGGENKEEKKTKEKEDQSDKIREPLTEVRK